MTDFGVRSPAGGATAAEQNETQAKLDTLHHDLTSIILAILNEINARLATVNGYLDEITEQVTETFVDAVVFDSTDETYTSESYDCVEYRGFVLLIDLGVTLAPTDIQIQVRFSDDDTTFYRLMNGPFGGLRFEDVAGNKTEALVGKCLAQYMDVHCISSGCSGTNKFTLTVKAVLTR